MQIAFDSQLRLICGVFLNVQKLPALYFINWPVNDLNCDQLVVIVITFL